MAASPPGRGGIAGALGCPVPGEQLPQEAASPLGALARLCQRMPKTEMENLAENANSQLREENSETGCQAGNTQPHAAPPESLGRASGLHGDRLPALPGQQSLKGTGSHPAIVPSKTKPAQGLGTSRQARPKLRASWSKATQPWQQHCLEEEELPEQTGHDHLASLPWLDGRAGQVNAKDGRGWHQRGQGDEPPSPGASRCTAPLQPHHLPRPCPSGSCCQLPGTHLLGGSGRP
ncbi:uncharacterized protein LOC135412707 [Pseudopipra pipra]|uniref:uncharacterized protein LOC135412707 n=1 Tax=Pseudopipra pipra TaxID=415032 RepID=UPI00313A12C5